MLTKVNRALLITEAAAFSEYYSELAEDMGVMLQVEPAWNKKYRVSADIIIAGSKHIENINEMYHSKTIIILKEDESPIPYIEKGFTRFIFDYKNNFELQTALYSTGSIVTRTIDAEYEEIIKKSSIVDFCHGDYEFRFKKNLFYYKGKMIYLTEATKKYLAQWLLNGKKDNSKRMLLCNLRKKYGVAFLSDVDNHGKWNNEEIQNN